MAGTTTAYKIVSHKDAQDTEDEVNSLLKDHYWELHREWELTDTGNVLRDFIEKLKGYHPSISSAQTYPTTNFY